MNNTNIKLPEGPLQSPLPPQQNLFGGPPQPPNLQEQISNVPKNMSNTISNIKENSQDALKTATETLSRAADAAEKAIAFDANDTKKIAAEKFPIFLIAPTTFSYLISVVIIVLLFIIYLIIIGAVASFQSKFFPNVYMFWDFVTTGNTSQYTSEFEQYIKNVMLTAQNNANAISSESFTGSKNTEIEKRSSTVDKIGNHMNEYLGQFKSGFSWLYQEFLYIWNHLLLNTIIDGKTINVVRK